MITKVTVTRTTVDNYTLDYNGQIDNHGERGRVKVTIDGDLHDVRMLILHSNTLEDILR